ncbi:MAG: thioredoxin family protein [Phycisphaerales bacterium]
MPTLNAPDSISTVSAPLALRRWVWALLALIGALAAVPAAHAQLADSGSLVKFKVVPALKTAAPGDTLPVALVFDIEPGWHIWPSEAVTEALPKEYARFDGAIYLDLEVTVAPASGATAAVANIQWPAVHGAKADIGDGPQTYGVYEGRTVALLPVIVGADAKDAITISVKARLQACNSSTCAGPGDVEATATLPIGAERAAVGPEDAPLFAGFDPTVFGRIKDNPAMGAAGPAVKSKPINFPLFGYDFKLDPDAGFFFPLMLVLAFVGGAILNFTPCVLPVVPLKIMGLAAAAAGDRKRTFMLGVAMTAGVVGFWLLLGVLLSSVKGFEQSNQLFQYPAFTIGVGVFIAAMAIGMAGFYNIGLPQWVYAIEPKHETYGGSVIFGVMTAVLSTPCTAPLMGAAAGWAVTTKSAGTILAVFFAIGLGMGSPYLVLSAFPQMAKRVPKSGPASDLLKQVMGLLLLAAAFFFIGAGVNGLLAEPSKLYWWVVGATGFAAGAWLVYRTVRIARTNAARATFVLAGLFIAGVSAAIPPVLTYEKLPWSRYTPAGLVAAQKSGQVVVLDFTADWCINCKTLEKTVLESDQVAAVLREPSVELLKADITGDNPDGKAKLAELGRVTIPLLVVFAPNGTEVFRSDAYTAAQVIDAVARARTGGAP